MDDVMVRTTSRVEELKLEDKTEEVNACLTEDLIDEIFARLPVKTLIRFRSLSKSWYSRIVSPYFIRMFAILRSMNTPDKVLIQHATCKVTTRRVREFICTLHSEDKLPLCPVRGYTDVTPFRFPPFSSIAVIGSCNGIICLHRNECFYARESGFILWNFSVRRGVTIPDPPFPRADTASLGFGCNPIANDYNIVGISYDGRVHASFIYSLKTNTWSEIDFPTGTVFSVIPGAILFNGVLHWMATETSNIRERMILTFNLSSHVFGTISLPEPSKRAQKLTLFNGYLGVISRERFTTWIWVMREYDNVASWSLVHELDMKQFDGVQVIKALSNGGLLFDTSGNSEYYKIYYPETGVLSRVLKFKEHCRMVDMERYVESLDLLDKGDNTISWEKKRRKGKVSP